MMVPLEVGGWNSVYIQEGACLKRKTTSTGSLDCPLPAMTQADFFSILIAIIRVADIILFPLLPLS